MAHVPRIYRPGVLGPGAITLDGETAKRLTKVMRLKAGDGFLVFAGDGKEYAATIRTVAKASVVAEIGEVVRQEAAGRIVETWCGLVRATRFDQVVEQCTEAGADIIRPLVTEFAARGETVSETRMERWERIAGEASEQSGRLYVPVVEQPVALEKVLHRAVSLVVLHPDGAPFDEAVSRLPASGRLAVAVGPEGGFSEDEVSRARGAGAVIARLGPTILRTETAAVVATALARMAATG